MSEGAQVIIDCPATGKPVSTGLRLDASILALLGSRLRVVRHCPHCGQTHHWATSDARLEGASAPPPQTMTLGRTRRAPLEELRDYPFLAANTDELVRLTRRRAKRRTPLDELRDYPFLAANTDELVRLTQRRAAKGT